MKFWFNFFSLLFSKSMFRTLLTISLTIMLLSCIRSETKINQKTDLLFSDIKQFQIKPRLCQYKEGLDCRNLRLGDEYHSTKEMERGYLYSCDGKIHRHLEVSKKESRGSISQRRHGTSSRNSGYLKEIFAQQKVFIQKDWTVVGGL